MGLFRKRKTMKPGQFADDAPQSPAVNGTGQEQPAYPPRSNSFFRRPSKASTSQASTTAQLHSLTQKVTLPQPPSPQDDPAGYLRSINAVRERSNIVYQKALTNQLNHFKVDMSKFEETAGYVVSIIKRDFAPDFASIPPHGRWQHFEAGGVPRLDHMMREWSADVDTKERTRRLLDLFLVSVLLDAGAGTRWRYKDDAGRYYSRSEGLAIASLEMFKAGLFSSGDDRPCQVDAEGLADLNNDIVQSGLQVSEKNPLDGVEGRTKMLLRLSDALRKNNIFFGNNGRPGNLLDYLLAHPATQTSSISIVPLPTLWTCLMDGLEPVWPRARTKLGGRGLGDAWPCSTVNAHSAEPCQNIVPFHKLTQWMTYSLMVPMERLLNIHFAGIELLTGLPEYRNGGLLMDTGLLTLRSQDVRRGLSQFQENSRYEGQQTMEVVPLFMVDDDVIVEWRAVTVGMLDRLLQEVNRQLGLTGETKLALAQVLEAGTWKGGREIAEVSRPNTRGPPIMILSDGTVF